MVSVAQEEAGIIQGNSRRTMPSAFTQINVITGCAVVLPGNPGDMAQEDS